MKKIFLILFLISYFLGIFLFFGCKDSKATEITQEDISSDYVYFSIDNSPYYIKERIFFKFEQEIKIDKNVVFILDFGSDICFEIGQCVRGWNRYRNGLSGHKIVVSSDFHAIIKPYDGELEVLEPPVGRSGLKMGFGLLSFYYPVLFVNIYNLDKGFLIKEEVLYMTEIVGDQLIKPLSGYLASPNFNSGKDEFEDHQTASSEEEHENEQVSNLLDEDNVGEDDIVVDKTAICDDDVAAEETVAEFAENQKRKTLADSLLDIVLKTENLKMSDFKQETLPATVVEGRIFLQVEKRGEAWYVDPSNGLRYYLGKPYDAFNIMKKLSLGVKHEFIKSRSIFPDRVLGRILLDTEDYGKAYYIDPRNKQAYYLGYPEDAFRVMRDRGIGITNSDLERIPSRY